MPLAAEELSYLRSWLAEEEAAAGASAEAGDSAASILSESPTDGANVNVNVPEEVKEKQRKKGNVLSLDNARKAKGVISDAIPDPDDFPTGSVSLLLFVALLLVFAIIPVAGTNLTRLTLVWKAILGQASLSAPGVAAAPQSYGPGPQASAAPILQGNWV